MNKIKKLGLSLLLGASLSACHAESDTDTEETGVSFTQINYTDHAVATVGIVKLKDPNKLPFKESVRKRNYPFEYSGSLVEQDLPFIEPESALLLQESHPYSQGGVQCCLNLPEQWQPNMRYMVRIEPDYYGTSQAEWEKEGETYYDYIVEIPKYTPEQRRMLYVLVLPENKIEIVVSNVGPTHEAWNGQTKGAPVPSYEYKLAQWEKEEKELKDGISYSEIYTDNAYKISWDSDARFSPEKLKGFKDYKDPAYRVFSDNESFEYRWNTIMYDDKEKLKGFKNSQDPAFRQYIVKETKARNQRWKEELEAWQKHKPKKPSVQEQK